MMSTASQTVFVRWCRCAWGVSWLLASAVHLLAAMGILSLTAVVMRSSRLPLPKIPTAMPLAKTQPFYLVEPPATDASMPVPAANAQAWLRLAQRDRRGEKPEKLLSVLEELLAAASGISDTSLAEIGALLGHKSGTYIPRGYYLEEVNPNADLRRAEVVRATSFVDEKGEAGYTIALQDKEKDEFVFRLIGQPAKELAGRGLAFGDKILVAGDEVFDLKGARIVDIRRGREKGGQIASYIVVLEDSGRRLRLCHLPAQEGSPWQAFSFLFARKPDGTYLHDPEDETTPLPQFFDHETGTLYRVTEAPPRQDGIKRARVEMLDAKGERLIFFVEGEQAAEMLERAAVLDRHPTLRRIFEKTGAADLLLQMHKENEPKTGD